MQSPNFKKVCVILGAGASHDVHGPSSTVQDKDWKPPLAADLFKIDGKPYYADVLNNYPGAAHLASTIHSLNGRGLEQELRRLSEGERTKENFKQVPPYIRDIIVYSSQYYTKFPFAYSVLIRELIDERDLEVLFLTLNYDTLLEQAIWQSVGMEGFNRFDDYVKNPSGALVIKLHGSTDWFVDLVPGHSEPTFAGALRDLDISAKSLKRTMKINRRWANSPIYERIGGGVRLYPVMTAPLAGKEETDVVCPDDHIRLADEFLKNCARFLIIGTSGGDDDLMRILARGIGPHQTYLNMVGDRLARDSLSRFEDQVPQLRPSQRYNPQHADFFRRIRQLRRLRPFQRVCRLFGLGLAARSSEVPVFFY